MLPIEQNSKLSTKASQVTGMQKLKDSSFAVDSTLKKYTTPLNKIEPFSLSSPSAPGISNAIFLPYDVYYTGYAFLHGIWKRDREEIQDATIHLLGMPLNLFCTIGSLLQYGAAFHIIPDTFTLLVKLVKISYIVGLFVCVVEGVLDAMFLRRQYFFHKQYDFQILSDLKDLIETPNAKKCIQELDRVIKELERPDSKIFDNLEKEKKKSLLSSLKDLKNQLEDQPYFRELIIPKSFSTLQEIAEIVLTKNLETLNTELSLSEKEVQDITKDDKTKTREQQKKIDKTLKQALINKLKTLARRVRPRFVAKACQETSTIMTEMKSIDPAEKEKGVHESLALMKDMEIQSIKKTIAHVLGICGLILAIVSTIALLAGAPMGIPFVLMALATTLSLCRFSFYKGFLDAEGWSFSFIHLLPEAIRKWLFLTPENHIEHLRGRSIIPLSSASIG